MNGNIIRREKWDEIACYVYDDDHWKNKVYNDRYSIEYGRELSCTVKNNTVKIGQRSIVFSEMTIIVAISFVFCDDGIREIRNIVSK